MSMSYSVLEAMEKGEEESSSSSEEETEEEEDVPLDSDMEQVSGKNLATYSAQASTHPLNTRLPSPRRNPQHPASSEPKCLQMPSHLARLFHVSKPQPFLSELTPLPA